MNLSVGMIGGLTVVIAGFCMQVLHLPIYLSMFIGLFVGVGTGYLNGLIITKFKLNSFVVTLATSLYSAVL